MFKQFLNNFFPSFLIDSSAASVTLNSNSNASNFSISRSDSSGEIIRDLNQLTVTRSINGTRKFKKFLTTCKHCGHYRFGRSNKKNRIVNASYPFEHSSKGGCHVPQSDWIPVGMRLRRICHCQFCSLVAQSFKEPVSESNKKANQFIYMRSKDQELMWTEMKIAGWRCWKGYYYEPGRSIKGYEGLNSTEAFRLYRLSK